MSLKPELEKRLRSVSSLPSPPNVALNIIELARDPEPNVQATADAIAVDPALTVKILRMANSPLYGQRRSCENLRQALIVLGLNATLSLALSFSLAMTVGGAQGDRLDYGRCWRRAMLSATVNRALARALGLMDSEGFFLAGMLQDIGILAIDKAFPETYAGVEGTISHDALVQLERERLGADHAEIGAWLIGSWNMPEFLCITLAASHDPLRVPESDGLAKLSRCLGLSGMIADMWLDEDGPARATGIAECADEWLGLDRTRFAEVLADIRESLPDTELVYETSLMEAGEAQDVLDLAKDILLARNLKALHEMSSLRETAESLESRTQELEEANRRDTLTGAFSRAFLEERLNAEFQIASNHGWPLSVLFVDLDHFKSVNDTHGHAAGDQLLKSTVQVLTACTRPSDILARYGGEEFVVVLPGSSADQARTVAHRLVSSCRAAKHTLAGGFELSATISLGIATLAPGAGITTVHDLVAAADAACYAAKTGGRDRFMFHGDSAESSSTAAVG